MLAGSEGVVFADLVDFVEAQHLGAGGGQLGQQQLGFGKGGRVGVCASGQGALATARGGVDARDDVNDDRRQRAHGGGGVGGGVCHGGGLQ